MNTLWKILFNVIELYEKENEEEDEENEADN